MKNAVLKTKNFIYTWNRKVISFVLAFSMLTIVFLSTVAMLPVEAKKIDKGEIDDLQNIVDSLNKELEEKTAFLAEMKASEEKLLASQALFKNLVKQYTEELKKTSEKQKECEAALAEFKEKSRQLEEKRAELKVDYMKTLRRLRESRSISALEIIFSAESFIDLLKQIETAKDLAKSKSNAIDILENRFEKIEEEQNTLEKELAKQVAIGKQLLEVQKEAEKSLEQANREATLIAEEILRTKGIIADLSVQAEEGEKELIDLIRRYEAQLEQEKLAKQTLLWPLDTYNVRITSPYGYRYDPISGAYRLHAGIDIAGPNSGDIFGDNIYASLDGTVIRTVNSNGHTSYGTYVLISHGGNERYDGAVSTLYAHMQYNSLTVKKGDYVKQGQVIGKAGTTGASNGPHLHYEVRIDGLTTDPLGYDFIRYIDGTPIDPYKFIRKGW